MPNHPIFAENRNGSARIAIALMLVMVTVLLVAVCAGQSIAVPENAEKNTTRSGTGMDSTYIVPIRDKERAEKTVADADDQIKKVDAVIAWFKGNQSTSNDPQLLSVITERENAMRSLSEAKDELANGNYAQAQLSSQTAYEKANKSYNDALQLQFAGCPRNPDPIPPVVILAFLGISIFPALLTIILHSQSKYIPSVMFRMNLRPLYGIPGYLVFTGSLFVSLILLITGRIGYAFHLDDIGFLAYFLWLGLTVVIIIGSVGVLGNVLLCSLRPAIIRKDPDDRHEGEVRATLPEKIKTALVIVVLVLLVLVLLVFIRWGTAILWINPVNCL